MDIAEKFFCIVRLGLGLQSDASPMLTVEADEWHLLFRMSERQALTGLLLEGAQRLGEGSFPPRQMLFKMMSVAKLTEKRNFELTEKCRWLTRVFDEMKLGSRILKGQGIAALYPNPMSRMPGDIDIWVHKGGGHANKNAKAIIMILKNLKSGTLGKATYYHVDWTIGGVEVEVHYRPMAFNNPSVNRRFQKWSDEVWKDRIERNGFFVPSDDFNAVYLLVHLYHHILFEGVGLRQVCDYAVFLNRSDYNHRLAARRVLEFNMTRFACGMMWVLGETMHLDNSKMFVEPDVKEGRFILSEIMKAGNFGKYDKRIDHSLSCSVAGSFFLRTKHRARFLFRYPSEILWDIPFRLYHWAWRKYLWADLNSSTLL